MGKFSLLFKAIDPSDRHGIVEKGGVAAKILRIFAVIAMIYILIISVPIIMGGGLRRVSLGGASIDASATGVSLMVIIVVLIFIIGIISQIITLWYTGKFMRKLEQNELLGMTIPVIFLIINLISVYGSISPKLNIVGLIINGFITYLWFVIISTINHLKNIA